MRRTVPPAGRELGRVAAPLALLAGPAWLLLALGSGGIAVPELCSSALLWSVPSVEGLRYAFTFVPPQVLAMGWGLMVAAMMLPTLAGTLGYVRARSLGRLRGRLVALVICGYLAVWLAAGPVMLGLALALHLAAPGGGQVFIAALAVALLWQVSPWKQAALNRCHRRPAIAAFAPEAYGDALRLGLGTGLWCLQSCWALMLASLLAPGWHFAAMAVVALFIWAERLEPPRPPAWRLRAPLRAWRLASFRLASVGR